MLRISYTQNCFLFSSKTKQSWKFWILTKTSVFWDWRPFNFHYVIKTCLQSCSPFFFFNSGLTFVLIISTYEYLEQKVKLGVKNPSHFPYKYPFLKMLVYFCPRDLCHDIWQMIFKSVVFHQIISSERSTHTNYALYKGAEVWITLYCDLRRLH